jgi:hypothetical protein
MIASARIDLGTGSDKAKVFVTVDGREELLFDYFKDELAFSADEFVGLTIDQGLALFTERDIAYLRS